MNKILIDEATVKQALEALEESQTNNDSMEFHDRKNKAIAALKAARAAQPAQHEPVEVQMRVGNSYWAKVDRKTPTEQFAKAQQLMRENPGVYEMRLLYTTPPAPVKQEPVGYWLIDTEVVEFGHKSYHDGSEWEAIYTSPQRKP